VNSKVSEFDLRLLNACNSMYFDKMRVVIYLVKIPSEIKPPFSEGQGKKWSLNLWFNIQSKERLNYSGVDSGGAGGARATQNLGVRKRGKA
jgi:hypothetical protein